MDVEGKVFWSVIARRMNAYLIANKYIDTSVQKGGIPGMSGCLEHTAVITQLIREAKKDKKSLSITWLDLERAYPSLPHNVILYSMGRYHFPQELIEIVSRYLGSMEMRFRVGHDVTKWQKLERGIMAGCTVSVVLFVTAMNVIIKGAESECRGPVTSSGVRQPSCRAFMDDITTMTSCQIGTRWILQGLDKMVLWARMRFKPQKSRTLTIVKGKIKDQRFKIGNNYIPTIKDNPIRCLGKVFDESLRDVKNCANVQQELSLWLSKIDNSHLPGKFKAWCFQFGVIPRLQWPFLLYDFPISAVTRMEQLISRYVRKWFGLPPGTASANLYSCKSPLPKPLSSTVEVFKATKARAVTTLRFSKDKKVNEASEAIASGRSWKPQQAVNEAISRLNHKDVVGTVCRGRLGLGNYENSVYKNAPQSTRRKMIANEVRGIEEERRQSALINLSNQGDWSRWEHTLENRPGWNEIWRVDESKLKFLLRSVFDLLPSPTNLHMWGLSDNTKCALCKEKYCNLQHILSSCKQSLADGRYRWRHDKVLKVIAQSISNELPSQIHSRVQPLPPIQFVPAGSKTRLKPNVRTPNGLLHKSNDWTLLVDVGKQLRIPQEIICTNLRPDIVLYSRQGKCVILVELTVPWEDNLDEAHQRKAAKYAELVSNIEANGWRTYYFSVEVGTRGFPSISLRRMFLNIGFSSRKAHLGCKAAGKAAEESSHWLWLKREDQWQKGGA